MKQLRTRILMPLLIGLLLLSFTRSASANETMLEFRVTPSAGSSVSDGGDYFVLSMDPGEVRTQSVEVRNWSSERLTVRLAAVDAATAQTGGVDYGAEQLPTEAIGSWINLAKTEVDLAARRSTEVSFEVAVPPDAGSGVHLGGVVVWVDGIDDQPVDGAQATMDVQSRRAVAVQIDVPGAAAPVLEIRGAQAEARPDGLYLAVDLFNSGTDFAKGIGSVAIEGEDLGTFDLDTVVPGTGTHYPFRWAGSGIPNGSYDVAIEVDYGIRIVTWRGQVTVGPAVQHDLRARGVGAGAGSQLQTYLLAGSVALLLAATLFFVLRRRSSGTRTPWMPRLRLPRLSMRRVPISVSRRPVGGPRKTSVRRLEPAPATPPAFVPRSEELQRRVPPPPPPPPTGFVSPAPPPPPPGVGCAA